MQRPRTLLLFGFLLWLIPFLVAFAIFPLREANRPLFESIMPVVMTVSVVVLAKVYFATVDEEHVLVGAVAGITWLLMSIGIDLLMFMWGPMKMTFPAYMADIGVTYLIYPVVTIGLAWANESRQLRGENMNAV